MALIELQAAIESHPLLAPFRITGRIFTTTEVVLVTLRRGPHVGRGEAAGVFYKNDDPAGMLRQIESIRSQIEGERLTRRLLAQLLPAGGARNALDCALWDLEAHESGIPAWETAGIKQPAPLLTTWTLGAAEPAAMAASAIGYADARALKLKLTGESSDAERVRAVRRARPDVWMGVDANQGFTAESLRALLPVLVAADVRLLEQPFPIGCESDLAEFKSTIPLAADESIQDLADLRRLAPLFDVVNIKLDKCGGLTEALAMAREARSLGLEVMVGNMLGTSLAMAPAYVVGQLCDVVDLDGPLFLAADREPHATYINGCIQCPDALWGAPDAHVARNREST